MTQTFSDNNDSKPDICSVCLRIGNIPLTKSMQESYTEVVQWHLKLDHNHDITSPLTIFKDDIRVES